MFSEWCVFSTRKHFLVHFRTVRKVRLLVFGGELTFCVRDSSTHEAEFLYQVSMNLDSHRCRSDLCSGRYFVKLTFGKVQVEVVRYFIHFNFLISSPPPPPVLSSPLLLLLLLPISLFSVSLSLC